MFPKQETFKSTISTETGVGHLHLRTDEHSDDDEDEEVPGWACELYKNFANLRFLSLQPFRFAVKETVVPGPHLKLFFPGLRCACGGTSPTKTTNLVQWRLRRCLRTLPSDMQVHSVGVADLGRHQLQANLHERIAR